MVWNNSLRSASRVLKFSAQKAMNSSAVPSWAVQSLAAQFTPRSTKSGLTCESLAQMALIAASMSVCFNDDIESVVFFSTLQHAVKRSAIVAIRVNNFFMILLF